MEKEQIKKLTKLGLKFKSKKAKRKKCKLLFKRGKKKWGNQTTNDNNSTIVNYHLSLEMEEDKVTNLERWWEGSFGH